MENPPTRTERRGSLRWATIEVASPNKERETNTIVQPAPYGEATVPYPQEAGNISRSSS